MILSDRDLRRQIQQGRLRVEPFDPRAVQPSSIDLRVSDEFRVFANNRHPYIDVRRPMEDLTELVRATDAEPFILHPGEFVLASTLEQVSLPDDLVGRLEGKSSLGRLGLLIHSSLPGSEPVLFLDTDSGRLATRPIADIVGQSLRGAVVSFDPGTFDVAYHQVTGWYEGPPDRIFEVTLASGRRVRLTAGHNLFTLDHQGDLAKVRTGALVAGTGVAVPARIPDPPAPRPRDGVLAWPRPLLGSFLDGAVDRDASGRDTRAAPRSPSGDLVADLLPVAARLGTRAAASSHGRLLTSTCDGEHRPPTAVGLRDRPRDEAGPSRTTVSPLPQGGLLWDRVVDVRDTGATEPIFDLEVRPNGRAIENFLAGHGGVFVSNTAGFVDAGWSGHLTLELSNVANLPITLYPGMRIGQLCLFQMSSPAERPYGTPGVGSKYQGQRGPTASRYHENFDDEG